uniref:Uncharacterized protein n=1 Tax=Chenopodium quinoa TaxID=63459 RepID=A0A803N9K2_CHEQI
MDGVSSFKDMRVEGHHGKKKIQLLLDSGSNHNFIDANKALKMASKVEFITPLWVKVADGNQIKYDQIIKGFTWRMQGVEFSADVFLSPLFGSDLALGIQWFSMLDPILWDVASSPWNSTLLALPPPCSEDALGCAEATGGCCTKGAEGDRVLSKGGIVLFGGTILFGGGIVLSGGGGKVLSRLSTKVAKGCLEVVVGWAKLSGCSTEGAEGGSVVLLFLLESVVQKFLEVNQKVVKRVQSFLVQKFCLLLVATRMFLVVLKLLGVQSIGKVDYMF